MASKQKQEKEVPGVCVCVWTPALYRKNAQQVYAVLPCPARVQHALPLGVK